MARRSTASDAREAAAVARDQAAQERGKRKAPRMRYAPTFVHCTHPDTEVDVVFKPGELLPEWVHDADISRAVRSQGMDDD